MIRVIKSYKAAWHFLLSHKSLLLILFIANIGTALLALYPFKSYVTSVFDKSDTINTLAEGFDYNIILDWLNQYGVGVGLTFSSIISFLLIYVLWSTFATGGILGMYQNSLSEGKSKIQMFWSSGATYFFRLLRINIYTLLAYTLILILMFFFFTKDGMNVFNMESEETLISRFWILLALLFICGFFISIFRDLARANVITSNAQNIFQSNLKSFKSIWKKDNVRLSLFNLLFIGIVSVVYFFIKEIQINSIVVVFIISQLYLILRLCYRVVRSCSFLDISKN